MVMVSLTRRCNGASLPVIACAAAVRGGLSRMHCMRGDDRGASAPRELIIT
jgi:hypothetical protein